MDESATWALYVRHGDHDALWSDVRLLLGMIERRGARVAGIYADTAPADTPELAVMIEHALFRRFTALAVADVAHLGHSTPAALQTAVCLYDLGVSLYACTAAGSIRMTLVDVGRELGAAGAHGAALGLAGSRVGLADARRRTPPSR